MAKRRSTMSPEARAAYAEIEKGVARVARGVGDIQRTLRKAERTIEADARARIRELRREAKTQLVLLKTRRQEATRMLGRLRTAAGESWRDVKKSADRTLTEARHVAESTVGRVRRAIRG